MPLKTTIGAFGVVAVVAFIDYDWNQLLGTTRVASARESGACRSAVELVENVRHYDFFGSRANDANQSLRRQLLVSQDFAGRTKRFAGQADWHIEWRTCIERRQAACRIGGITSTVHATYTLPRWVDRQTAPEGLQSRWDSYARNLLAHERGHGRIALEVARLIERDLVGLENAAGCEALNQEVADRIEALMRHGETLQNDYDRVTDHGQTQGAIFPF